MLVQTVAAWRTMVAAPSAALSVRPRKAEEPEMVSDREVPWDRPAKSSVGAPCERRINL